MSGYIYIIQLEKGKWYIGRSTNVEERFKQHQNEQGTDWTREYKPIAGYYRRISILIYDENNITLHIMWYYGIENVRGGEYTNRTLNNDDLREISRLMRGVRNLCRKCGERGHYAAICGLADTTIHSPDKIMMSKNIMEILEPFECLAQTVYIEHEKHIHINADEWWGSTNRSQHDDKSGENKAITRMTEPPVSVEPKKSLGPRPDPTDIPAEECSTCRGGFERIDYHSSSDCPNRQRCFYCWSSKKHQGDDCEYKKEGWSEMEARLATCRRGVGLPILVPKEEKKK